MPNTPSWHRRNLQDLLALVDRWGLPTHFLTLTADEFSPTHWEEVDSLQDMLDRCGCMWAAPTLGLGEKEEAFLDGSVLLSRHTSTTVGCKTSVGSQVHCSNTQDQCVGHHGPMAT